MHIKSMVVDGFKSYGQRTEINGFDPLFNAITGLNGSGKSNILDAICFLLGITNLSQVRASSLQELVYKNGQAGITKATVSITFDNRDKDQSPVGYQHQNEITVTRQVVVGGRNKYLINGCNAQNNRVQDLFRSVQLNVNNPHFLIMQGRITKVLNMKPPEILSMIEEAAGTKMYESKKQSAQRTIEKKDAKLKEIDAILNEEITPTLTKLKEDRASFLEYQKVQRELEHQTKLCVAYQYVTAEELCQSSEQSLATLHNDCNKLKKCIANSEDEIKNIEKYIVELEKRRAEETSGTLDELEKELKEYQLSEAKATSNLENKKENLKAEIKKKKGLEKSRDEDASAVKMKENELNKLEENYSKLVEASENDAQALTKAQKHFQAVSSGLSSNSEGEEATLADQLIAAKSELVTIDTESKQAGMKLKHIETELNKKRAVVNKSSMSYVKDQATYEAAQKDIKKIDEEINKLGYTEGKQEQLLNSRKALQREVSDLAQRMETLESKYPQTSFDYKNPEPNFNRKSVHGLVCKLIDLKDPNTARALEIAAGGKLYNVVVDTETTAKKLLQKGELKRRCTIIPLNKISAHSISHEVIKRAENLVGKENVHTALSLVGYERELQKAMEFVFGSTFVCRDMDTAKRVAFADGIRKRCVTLDGDIFDPSGTLSGGSNSNFAPILTQMQGVKEIHETLTNKQNEFNTIEKNLQTIESVAQRYMKLKQQFELKQREAELLQQKLHQSSHHQQLEEIKEMEATASELQAIIESSKEKSKLVTKKASELEAKIKNAKSIREKELKAAEVEVKKCKTAAETSLKHMKAKQQDFESLKLELEELARGQATCEDQINAVEEAVKGYETQIESLTEVVTKAKQAVSDAEDKVQQQKDLLRKHHEDIEIQHRKKESVTKEVNDNRLKLKQMDHEILKLKSSAKDASEKLVKLAENYEWIKEEKKYFGQPNTAYDFQANNPKDAARRLQKLQETKDKLGKNVNTRAMNLIGKAEEQYNDLIKKKKIVEDDKEKIAAVMKELDEKKKEALKTAWEQVNSDLGSIFGTLLPGSKAKLVPPEGCTVLDGLEFKVAFGNVWKESLSELSGGQRSLVALSLVLAMLLFKPAPIYILDEVDAALDLSHTQNIGQMLRAHFKSSQFVVVSLKDGMFSNANVLFKTKFVDGMSGVNRYAQNQ